MRQRIRAANEFYRTPLECVKLASDLLDKKLRWWEPCAGDGAISLYYKQEIILASDIEPRHESIKELNILTCDKPSNIDAIITNPPFLIAFDILDRVLFSWKIPALFLIRIEPLSTQKRNFYTKYLSHMNIISSLINFETEDGRIVHGNGTMRCAWCLFVPTLIPFTVTKWCVYREKIKKVNDLISF